jgi:hypothetical protein
MISNAVNTLNFVTELRDWSLHPLTKEKLRGKPFFPGVPHIVILGAGASKAAFPDGDKNGKPLPLLDDLANIVGRTWTDVIKLASPPVTGFEAQFSWIRKCGKFADEIARVEAILFQYFDELEIPDIATIYDYLVLGLRAKDTIATFNWDPLLLLAHRRNRHVAELPDLRFLHGSVAYFTCSDHDVLGSANEGCPICGKFLDPGRLFYPEADKDYAKHAVIHRDWQAVTRQLSKAFHLTIFGYSGPETDYNARQLLLSGWGKSPLREISHVEIIDIKGDDQLRRCWREFIPYHHDMVVSDFWQSTIAKWPRRTADYKLSASLYGIPAEPMGPLRTNSLAELQDWHAAIASTEAFNQPVEGVLATDQSCSIR